MESSNSEEKLVVVVGIALANDVPTSADPICSSARYLIAIGNQLLVIPKPDFR